MAWLAMSALASSQAEPDHRLILRIVPAMKPG